MTNPVIQSIAASAIFLILASGVSTPARSEGGPPNAGISETEAGSLNSLHPGPDSPDNWDLTDLYSDAEHWQRALTKNKRAVGDISRCEGTLADSAKALSSCLNTIYASYRQILRIYTYALLRRDTNLADSENGERYAKAQSLLNQYKEITSFVEPELIAIGAKTLHHWLQTEGGLKDYEHFIRDALRRGAHILSPCEETILAAAADPLDTAGNAYSIFTNAELPWPEVSLTNGKTFTLRASNYTKYRSTDQRNDRKIIFDAFFGAYQNYRETLASMLSGEIKRHTFSARMRGFESSLQQALATDNIPEQVYHTLIATVSDNLDTLHRYLKLHTDSLGINNARYYDVYPSVIKNPRSYSIAKAKQMLAKAVEPLGEEYGALLRDSMEQNWTHPYPADGKRSGAYVMGAAYDVHPYILLNHNNNFASLSTFAHEWGHAIHTLLSNAAQPFPTADYPTFIAEIASTANEVLLFNYLYDHAGSDEERLFYLFQELQSLRGTFFRQTQFAEFELAIHREIERGEALSGDKLNRLYGNILKRYYGHKQGVMSIDDTYAVEWAYIPHFYRNFYVYQYATSISAAYYLVENILSGNDPEGQRYLSILKAGGSDYPYDILKRAGADMAEPEVYLAVIRRFEKIMNEIETLKTKTSTPRTPK